MDNTCLLYPSNEALTKLLEEAKLAMDGDSNDAEHEALFNLVEYLGGL